MAIKSIFNRIVTSPFFTTSVFLGTGVYKTYHDYKNAQEKYKNKFLVQDTVALGGAMTGMFICGNLSKYAENFKFIQNFISNFSRKITKNIKPKHYFKNQEELLNQAKIIIKNTMSNCSMFTFGVLGALLAGKLLKTFGFKEPSSNTLISNENSDTQNKIIEKFDEDIEKIVGENTKNIIYKRITDMPQLHMLSNAAISSAAIDLAKEQEDNKKLAHTTSSIINNSLMPMFFLSLSSAFTSKMKLIYQIPIIFGSLVGGTAFVNYLHKVIHKD